VGGKSLALRIGFPDVHFTTAGTIVTCARVGVITRGFPVLTIGFSVDPLEVMGALGITVTCSVLSTSLVRWEPVKAIDLFCKK
jgi:hypothetical protein